MILHENKPSCILVDMYGKTVKASWLSSDVNCDEFVEAFYGILVAQGFQPNSILESFLEFANDRLPDEKDED